MDKVLNLADYRPNYAVTENSEVAKEESTSFGYAENSQRDRVRPRERRRVSRLDDAFEAIAATLSDEIGEVEKSNSFDEWKDIINEEAAADVERSAPNRQILGILLAATMRREFVAFRPEELRAFRAITNLLRRPGAAMLDVSATIKYLKEAGVRANFALDLSELSTSRLEELDRFLDDLIAKHS